MFYIHVMCAIILMFWLIHCFYSRFLQKQTMSLTCNMMLESCEGKLVSSTHACARHSQHALTVTAFKHSFQQTLPQPQQFLVRHAWCPALFAFMRPADNPSSRATGPMNETKRKDYTFRRRLNEKPSIIPGCSYWTHVSTPHYRT